MSSSKRNTSTAYDHLPKKFYLIFSDTGVYQGWVSTKATANEILFQRGRLIIKKMYRHDVTEYDLNHYLNTNDEFVMYYTDPDIFLTFTEFEMIDGSEQYLTNRINDSIRKVTPILYSLQFEKWEREALHDLFRRLATTFLNRDEQEDYEDEELVGYEFVNEYLNHVAFVDRGIPHTLKPELVQKFEGLRVHIREDETYGGN